MLSINFKSLQPFGVELAESIDARKLRELILDQGLVLIKNFDVPSDQELIDWACNLSQQEGGVGKQLLHWDFGPLMKMKFDPQAKNYLFSQEKVPFHWDGAFYQEPLFLLFYCDESSGEGGETFFCDTTSVFTSFGSIEKQASQQVQLNFTTDKLAHYGGKISVPFLQKHPLTDRPILRFAEEVRTEFNPVQRRVENDSLGLIHRLDQYLKGATYTHKWDKGDLILVDNYRLIHGRKALGENTQRSFRRIQIM